MVSTNLNLSVKTHLGMIAEPFLGQNTKKKLFPVAFGSGLQFTLEIQFSTFSSSCTNYCCVITKIVFTQWTWKKVSTNLAIFILRHQSIQLNCVTPCALKSIKTYRIFEKRVERVEFHN